MGQLERAGGGALLHLGALEAHARANEGCYQFAVLVAVLLAQVVLDSAPAEIAVVGRPVEPVEDHLGRNLVAHRDVPVEGHLGLTVEAAQSGPAHLNGTQASEDETGRRELRAKLRLRAIGRVHPQRVVVTDAFAEAQDRHSRGVFVVEAGFGA